SRLLYSFPTRRSSYLAISTVILYANRSDSPMHYVMLAVVIAAGTTLVWLTFRAAEPLANRLGRTGINVVTRIMGLIMAAIGVEVMANGLRVLFPGMAGAG